ncbi:unnamed protein product [Rhizoctonia solani]|uniref:NACHT domain-containing protein n=1 Tax=Rhizoctonia solani TaxID=456999 RepID=A0A8H3CQL8_9AGAM|nr:unnamed protein product [Rhizoctonia solani]
MSIEDTEIVTNPIPGGSPIDNNAIATCRSSPVPRGPHEQVGIGLETPAADILIHANQEIPLRTDRAANDTPSNFAPIAPFNPTTSLSKTSSIAGYASTGPKLDFPGLIPSIRVKTSQNVAWKKFQNSLRSLEEKIRAFSLLPSAINSLFLCLNGLEAALANHQDFDDLATQLTTIIQLLEKHTDESSSIFMSDSTARIATLIEEQAIEIERKLRHAPEGTAQEAKMNEDIFEHYRQMKTHFLKLQTGASMSIGNIKNEHIMNTKLEGLNPSKQATYDSGLSAQINRRGCTEGTRIGVLDGLDDWLGNSSSQRIYWINGMAGTGKTTIASTFCERAERRKLLVASFFCTRNSAECRSATQVIPTIAYQLARYSPPFLLALCKVLEQKPSIGSKNILKQFEQLLKEPLQDVKDAIPDNLVVVIDALDECDDRNGIELVLDMLFRHAVHVPLKFLVTSRPESGIYDKMSAHKQSQGVIHLHDIESSLVQSDIKLYLKEELASVFPGQSEVEQLAHHSGTLFIYAATLVRYIHGKRSADPQKRLRAVLDMATGSTKKHAQIDALYETVLTAALGEGEPGVTEDIQMVLRVVLLAQEPIGVETIAKLADIDDPKRVVLAVHPLQSVIHRSEKTGLVSALHASFLDFMLTNKRSGAYFCDLAKNSQFLAQRCFLIMEERLRFNICGLETSYLPDEGVNGIQERIKTNIPHVLAYVCRYWASHLAFANGSYTLLTMLEKFLHHQLLFWMEILNLRREMPTGVEGLLKAQQWLMGSGYSASEVMLFADDARSFVMGYAVNPVSQCTPHIYISSLPFCPQSSSVYKHYRKRTQGLLELRGSLMQRREAAPLATWSPGSEILSLALSPDGTRVVIGCLDKTVSILSTYDGTVLVGPLQGHANSISSVVFSPDGQLVASASLGTFRVWDARNGVLIAGPFVGHMRHVNSVSFSPESTHVVTGGHDCTIRVWDIYKRTLVLGPLTGEDDREGFVLCVAFSPDGALIASGSADQTVQLWNSKNGAPAASPFRGHTGRVECLVFTPEGSRLVTGSNDSTIRVWNVPDGSIINNSFEGCMDGVNSLAVSRDGTRIAAGSSDRAVRVWLIDNGMLVAGPFFNHTDSIKSVAYSPDGTRVFSGSTDKKIHVWNVRDGNFPPPPLPSQSAVIAIRAMTFCPNNTHVLSSDAYNVIRRWCISDGSFETLPAEGNFFPTPVSMLSPDGSCVAGTSKHGKIQIMNTSNGSLVAGPFDVERTSLSSFGFSHNNTAIIMGCQDGTIKIVDLHNGKAAIGSFRGHYKGVSSLTESSDCSTLVSYSDYENIIRIWSIVTPALDLKLYNTSIGAVSKPRHAAVHEGWNIREDGWVVDNSRHLLFWLPPDVASAWCSPYATLVRTKFGTLEVPKQKPLMGKYWADCYIPD